MAAGLYGAVLDLFECFEERVFGLFPVGLEIIGEILDGFEEPLPFILFQILITGGPVVVIVDIDAVFSQKVELIGTEGLFWVLEGVIAFGEDLIDVVDLSVLLRRLGRSLVERPQFFVGFNTVPQGL